MALRVENAHELTVFIDFASSTWLPACSVIKQNMQKMLQNIRSVTVLPVLLLANRVLKGCYC